MEFCDLEMERILPAPVADFVLKDRYYGIISDEFTRAIKKGDVDNIVEGIDSAILNAQRRTRIRLSELDKARMNIMAQDAIVKRLEQV
jgi:hypothetical protein